MINFVLSAFVSLFLAGASGKYVHEAPAVDISARYFSASLMGNRIARVVSEGESSGAGVEILTVGEPRKVAFISIRSVAKAIGSAKAEVSALEFSEDGAFLAVEVSDEDVRAVVSVVDVRTETPIVKPLLLGSERTSACPHWATTGHRLFVRPVSVDLGDPRDKGIVCYNADDGSSSIFLKDFFVIGKDFCVTSEGLVAIVHQEDEKSKPHEAIVSLRFGADHFQIIRNGS